MRDFIVSLLSVVAAGTLISAICPKNGMKKPLLFLCGAVVAATLFAMFTVISPDAFSLPDFPEINEELYSQKADDAVARAAEKAIAEQLFTLTHDFSGEYPESVRVSVAYSDGSFTLLSASVFIPSENPSALAAYIYNKTGIEPEIEE